MKLKSYCSVEHKATVTYLSGYRVNSKNVIMPGASTCTIASSSCSCGAVVKNHN